MHHDNTDYTVKYIARYILSHYVLIITCTVHDYNFNCSVIFHITFKDTVIYFKCTQLKPNHYKCVITNIVKYMSYKFQLKLH